MKIFEGICIGLSAAFAILIVLYVRRELISHSGGTVDMNVRLNRLVPERGWAPGVGRFVGDELRWYRLFSFGLRPRRVITRENLVIDSRRPLEGAERISMPAGWVVLHCNSSGSPVEIALAEQTLTGFLSWIESAPPGALTHR